MNELRADPAAAGRPADGCGEFQIRIGRDGTWYYHESPIRRLALVKLFASVLRREADGSYWLVTPVERGRIAVDDAPFVAVELDRAGEGRNQVLTFRTNLDETVAAGESHPIRVETDPATGEPSPYVMVRAGLEARLSRAVFYQMVELGRDEADEAAAGFGVWSSGKFFRLGDLTEAT